MGNFTNEDIARYYDLSRTHYENMWDLRRSRSLHYGYWDRTTKNFHQALLNINKVLAQRAGISKTMRVLDAGCGVGGSSLWLAKNIGCSVTGISLSKQQIAIAEASATEEGLSSLANFQCEDFTNTSFPAETFDIIWAIESVCHAHDKADFLNEAYRLLKPGGKMVLADFFRKDGLKGADDKLILRWAEGWAIDDFSTREMFLEKMRAAGFKNIQIQNATENIQHSARRLYLAWFPGKLGGWLYNLTHKNVTSFGKKNIDTALLQYKSLKKGLWEYLIVTGEKG